LPWGKTQAQYLITFKSTTGSTTKPKYVATLDKFYKFAKEAFTIPLTQWSYLQCSVVNMAVKLQILLPKRSMPQTDVE
jgi:hypothetical protein